MPNPFDFIHEIREANEKLIERLDMIIERLDLLAELADLHNQLDAEPYIRIAGEEDHG